MPHSLATSGIVAQAFRLMQMSPVSSLGDGGEQGAAAEEQYPVALASCLEACDWSFARRVARLQQVAPEAVAVDPVLTFEFERPADLLVARIVTPAEIDWRLDADRLRADHPGPLHLRYTASVVDETRMPAAFRTAVAYRLAGFLAPRWSQSVNRAQALSDQAEDWIVKARRVDRTGASPQRYDDRAAQPDWPAAAVR